MIERPDLFIQVDFAGEWINRPQRPDKHLRSEKSTLDRMPAATGPAPLIAPTAGHAWPEGDWREATWKGGGTFPGDDTHRPTSLFQFWAGGLLAAGAWPVLLIEWLHLRHERNKQRQQLEKMPDHMLRDIGLSRGDIYGAFGKRNRL